MRAGMCRFRPCQGQRGLQQPGTRKSFCAPRLRPLLMVCCGQLCEAVLNECLRKDSKDNMSVCIIAFPGAPKAPA